MERFLRLTIFLWGLGFMMGTGAAAEIDFALPRSTPEAQGVSSSVVLAFVEAIDKADTTNSFMLVRHGHVVAEGWWSPYESN